MAPDTAIPQPSKEIPPSAVKTWRSWHLRVGGRFSMRDFGQTKAEMKELGTLRRMADALRHV